jgi:hypothetical protein
VLRGSALAALFMLDNLLDFCVHVLPGTKNYLLRIQYLAAVRFVAPGALVYHPLQLSLFSPREPSGDNGRSHDTPVPIGLFVGPRHSGHTVIAITFLPHSDEISEGGF